MPELLHNAQIAMHMMGTPHFPIVKTHPTPFSLQIMMSHPLIEEMRIDEHKEPRCPTPKAMSVEHALANLFNNELDRLLLIVNFTQMRIHTLELIDELRILTRRLKDIERGLVQS